MQLIRIKSTEELKHDPTRLRIVLTFLSKDDDGREQAVEVVLHLAHEGLSREEIQIRALKKARELVAQI